MGKSKENNTDKMFRPVRIARLLLCFLSLIGIFIYTNKKDYFIRMTSKNTIKNAVAASLTALSDTIEPLTPLLDKRHEFKRQHDRNLTKDLPISKRINTTSLGEKRTLLQNASILKNGTLSDGDDDDTFVKNRLFWNESMNGQNVYNYVHTNSDLCTRNQSKHKGVFLLIMCLTAPSETSRRAFIRRTWANVTYVLGKRVAIVFLLAKTKSDKMNQIIDVENRLYKDICLKDFIDSYENLTLKTMMGFRWVNSFCNQTKFVLKIDSDTVPNLRNLIRHLDKQTKETTYQGHLIHHGKPVRTNDTWLRRWLVPESAYPHPTYPSYANGPAYLVSGNLVEKIVSVSNHIPYILIEDVYGAMLMKTIGVIPSHDHRYTQKRLSLKSENTTLDSLCIFHRAFTVFHLNPIENLYKFWSLWTHFDTNRCSNSTGPLPYY